MKNKIKIATITLSTLIIVAIIAIKWIIPTFHSVSNTVTSPFTESYKVFNNFFSTKSTFNATFGPLISEEKCERLQFSIKRYVVFFRIVRYLGQDKNIHDYSQFYKLESDKKVVKTLTPYFNQYCEWEAKGALEFSFYIDMEKLDKWRYRWDKNSFTLTLYPPDIKANTPAELEPYKYRCLADSISIDEDATKKSLEVEIIRLKKQLANDQKQFMYSEAKRAIIKHYKKFFSIINKDAAKQPNINVIFPNEIKRKK